MIYAARKENKNCRIIVTAQEREDADDLYKAGADHVVLPRLSDWNYIVSSLKRKNKIKKR